MAPSQATRRNGVSKAKPQTAISTNTSTSTPDMPLSATLLPLLPTSLESLLLAIFPGTLLLGSLFSLLEPHARAAPYSAISQSHPAALAPSYFAQKRNLFNVFFVKIGWFWTTFAYVLFLFLHPSTGPSRSFVLTPRRVRGMLRWAMCTLWWAVVTQWFFGPPLIDRGFRLTGGACEIMMDEEARKGMSDTKEFVTSAACKLAGGQWKGGHDISGHVFLLVLGSGFLWMEILPVVMRYAGLREDRIVVGRDGKIGSAEREAGAVMVGREDGREDGKEAHGGVSAPLVVAGLSWWMLLMTAAYFHTWFEKFTGLLVAFSGLFAVYFLPRAIPAMRDVVGMPGV